MRVISGSLGGRRFTEKVGEGVRPTSDMVRESIFDKLSYMIDFEGIAVADICAGTGAMGIEAISRGAAYCCFVDCSRKSCNYISSALREFKVEKSQYEILLRKAETAPKYFRESSPTLQFDLIITDPPYAKNIINGMLYNIAELNLLAPDGVIVAEYSSTGGIAIPPGFALKDTRKFGETAVSYIINAK